MITLVTLQFPLQNCKKSVPMSNHKSKLSAPSVNDSQPFFFFEKDSQPISQFVYEERLVELNYSSFSNVLIKEI